MPEPNERRPLDHDETLERSELAQYLTPVLPADRDRVLAAVVEQHAPEPVIGRLRGLPAGRTFENVEQVWEALGGPAEPRF